MNPLHIIGARPVMSFLISFLQVKDKCICNKEYPDGISEHAPLKFKLIWKR